MEEIGDPTASPDILICFKNQLKKVLNNLVLKVDHLSETDHPDLFSSGCWLRKPAEVPSNLNN